jgi:hypothetical protein
MKYVTSKLLLSIGILTIIGCSKEDKKDRTNPVISMVSPVQNDTISSNEIPIQFKVTDNEGLTNETMRILDENNKTLFTETKSIFGTSYTYTNAIEIGGTNQIKKLTINIVCSDNASNTSASTTHFWVKI